jgi:hypothetical protein
MASADHDGPPSPHSQPPSDVSSTSAATIAPSMNVFLRDGDRTYHACVDAGSPTIIAPAGPYVCLLWDHDGELSSADRDEVATALLVSGCRYAVCAGASAMAWETAVDLAAVRMATAQDDAAEDAFILTTSHETEHVDDVAFFFVTCTNFGEHDFREFVVLHIGGTAKERLAVIGAVRAAALARSSEEGRG